MKKLLALFTAWLFLNAPGNSLHAQSEESRNKIQMTSSYAGKTIVTDLNSVSPSFSRYTDYVDVNPATDSAKLKGAYSTDKKSTIFLTLGVRKVDSNLLQLFSKRQTRFDGTITITDTYGKNPPIIFKFTKAALESYSDQFTTASYNDSYSAASVVISCTGLSINGINIEQ